MHKFCRFWVGTWGKQHLLIFWVAAWGKQHCWFCFPQAPTQKSTNLSRHTHTHTHTRTYTHLSYLHMRTHTDTYRHKHGVQLHGKHGHIHIKPTPHTYHTHTHTHTFLTTHHKRAHIKHSMYVADAKRKLNSKSRTKIALRCTDFGKLSKYLLMQIRYDGFWIFLHAYEIHNSKSVHFFFLSIREIRLSSWKIHFLFWKWKSVPEIWILTPPPPPPTPL